MYPPPILLADLALIGILILTLILFVTMVTSLMLFVPYVPSPMQVVEFMIGKANIKGNEIVYDLGCGDARLLIAAKKKYPNIRAIGYELPLGVWLLAKLRVVFSKQDISIRLGNFLKANLSDADIVFLYLVPEVMKKLTEKMERELRKGTRVVSHGFELPGKTPLSVERCPLPSWHFFRPKGKEGPRVYVYEW
ncbi:MAG TPA: methyltransferase [Candidatus Peribacterales bacterium]|nr:methyltransferase [Candidatus Peribacterales bacterium]